MKKVIKSHIFSFILGAIIFSGITVFASSFLAHDVTYTPNDETFDVSDVGSALDKLYEMEKQLGALESAECVSGSYVCGADCVGSTGQKLLDFEPTKFIEYRDTTSINFYNTDWDQSNYYEFYAASKSFARIALSKYFRIENGALYVSGYGSGSNGVTRHYIACK